MFQADLRRHTVPVVRLTAEKSDLHCSPIRTKPHSKDIGTDQAKQGKVTWNPVCRVVVTSGTEYTDWRRNYGKSENMSPMRSERPKDFARRR